jgi:hypothetical protein
MYQKLIFNVDSIAVKKIFGVFIKKQAHYWHLFYNSSDGFIEVAVGKKNQLTVTDEVLFEIFLHEINQHK